MSSEDLGTTSPACEGISLAGPFKSGPAFDAVQEDDGPPYETWTFGPFDVGPMTLTDGIVAVQAFTGKIKIQMKVVGKNVYTHTRNRERWTGPYFTIRGFDSTGLIILEHKLGQVNLICPQGSPFYVRQSGQAESSNFAKMQMEWSSSQQWSC